MGESRSTGARLLEAKLKWTQSASPPIYFMKKQTLYLLMERTAESLENDVNSGRGRVLWPFLQSAALAEHFM